MKTFFNKNNTMKIVSVIFAILLWTYVMSVKNPPLSDTIRSVRVNILNEAEMEENGLIIHGEREFRVDITVRGKRSDVLSLQERDIFVEADIFGYRQGTNIVPIRVRTKDNIEVLKISPETINIRLDEIKKDQREAVAILSGNPATGYTILQSRIQPSQAILKGPSTLLNRVARVVVNVDISDISESKLELLPLIPVDDNGNIVIGVEVSPETASVEIMVSRKKVVPVRPNFEGQVAEGFVLTGYEIIPSNLTIGSLVFNLDAVNALFITKLNINDLSSNTERLVPVSIPDGISLVESPSQVTVRLFIEPVIKRTFVIDDLDVTIINPNPRLSVSNIESSGRVRVVVEGVESYINSLDPEDIRLSVNLDGLQEGVHDLGIEAFLPEGVSVVEIVPFLWRVTLISN